MEEGDITPMTDRIERDEKLIDQIGKLLAVAASTKNPDEKETFEAKAMKLIADNNLDMAAIEIGGNGAKAAKRSDEKHAGGLYQFQRDLWQAVSDLNFCMYWNLYTYDPNKVSKYWVRRVGLEEARRNHAGGYRFEHRLVGRVVNIAATRAMTEYLEGAVERAVRERFPDQPNLWFTSEAAAFREGAVSVVIGKIYDRRREMLREEERKAAEAREAEDAKHAAGGVTANAVTLSSVRKSEEEKNYDFLHGEGAWAKKEERERKWDEEWQQRRKEAATRRAEEEAAYTRWAQENPTQAAREERKRRKAAERRSYNYRPRMETKAERRQNSNEFARGRAAGEKIGLDTQVSRGTKGLLK